MADIGVSSCMMWNAQLEEMFRILYENGIDEMELWAQHFQHRRFSVEEYVKLSALYPIKSCVHSYSWDLNLASMNEGIRQASVEEVKKAVRLAYDIGAIEVTVHPGRETMKGDRQIYLDYMHGHHARGFGVAHGRLAHRLHAVGRFRGGQPVGSAGLSAAGTADAAKGRGTPPSRDPGSSRTQSTLRLRDLTNATHHGPSR